MTEQAKHRRPMPGWNGKRRYTLDEVLDEFGVTRESLTDSYQDTADANPERRGNGCMIYREGQ